MRRICAAIVAASVLQVALVPPAQAGDDRRAVQLFEASKAHYQAGRFKEAIELLKEAYAIDKNPDLLYNMARSYEGLGDFGLAADTYEAYLRAAPNVPDKGSIETRIKTLRAKAAPPRPEQPAAPTPTPLPPVPDAAPDDSPLRGPLPWIITAFGAASLVAGAALRGAAFAEHAGADDERAQRDAVERQALAERLQTASTVTLAAGGAVSALGITLGVVGLTTAPSPKTAVWLGLGGAF